MLNNKNIWQLIKGLYFHLMYRLLEGLELDWTAEGSNRYVAFNLEEKKYEITELEIVNSL